MSSSFAVQEDQVAVTEEIFLIFWAKVRESRCLLWCANCIVNGSSCISPRISDQSSTIHSDSLNNLNYLWNNWKSWTAGDLSLFNFHYDWIRLVNMTGKTKVWPVKSPCNESGQLSVDRPFIFRALIQIKLNKDLTETTKPAWKASGIHRSIYEQLIKIKPVR